MKKAGTSLKTRGQTGQSLQEFLMYSAAESPLFTRARVLHSLEELLIWGHVQRHGSPASYKSF